MIHRSRFRADFTHRDTRTYADNYLHKSAYLAKRVLSAFFCLLINYFVNYLLFILIKYLAGFFAKSVKSSTASWSLPDVLLEKAITSTICP